MTPKPKRKMEEVDPSLIISTKRRKIIAVDSGAKDYFQKPRYTKCGDMCGGKLSTAILGPLAYQEKNSDADSKLPKGILKAREKYPQCGFKAGHLLNATLGGSGTDSNNLIILTHSANGTCNTFDNKIKSALNHLKHVYESLANSYVDITKVDYGVKVEIVVDSATWGKEVPECHIHTGMHMKASVWGTLDVSHFVDSNGDKVVLTESQVSTLKGHVSNFLSDISAISNYAVPNKK